MIGCLAALFLAAAFYFYKQRKKISFLTRSPLTVTLSLIILGIDSVLTTLIFSGVYLGESIFHWQCDLGIICATFGQFGFMLATGLRLYRISKVYNTYLRYLKVQKEKLSRPIGSSTQNNSPSHDSTSKGEENMLSNSSQPLEKISTTSQP